MPLVWRIMKAIFSGVAFDAAMIRSPSFSRSVSSTTTTSSPAAIAADRSGLAAYPYHPATQTYLSLPPQYGPYVVRDGQGRYVGVLDTRGAGEMQPTYTGPHDGQY